MDNTSIPAHGLIAAQDVVAINIPSALGSDVREQIMSALSERPAHRIVSITMASYGEYPLSFQVVAVIEYV